MKSGRVITGRKRRAAHPEGALKRSSGIKAQSRHPEMKKNYRCLSSADLFLQSGRRKVSKHKENDKKKGGGLGMSGRKEEHNTQKIRVNKASLPSLEFSKLYLTAEAKIIILSVVILSVCVGVI